MKLIGKICPSLAGAALLASFGCARTITIGKDPDKAPATVTKSTEPHRYKVGLPPNNTEFAPLLLEMLNAFNAGVGYDVLILPAPIYHVSSELKWQDDVDLGDEHGCVAKPIATDSLLFPAFSLTFSLKLARANFAQRGHLADLPIYKTFAHCIGHAMGLAHVTDSAAEVMSLDPTKAASFDAFYAKVREVNAPTP